MTYTDSEILAKLKAQADAAWAKSARLARMADTDWNYRDEWLEALERAQEASRRYQAFLPEIPHVRWMAEPVGEEAK